MQALKKASKCSERDDHPASRCIKKGDREIPIMILERDIVDISSYNEADTHQRIDGFIETLETAKSN